MGHAASNSSPASGADRVDMSVDLAGLVLANPMMTASGTCGYGEEYTDFMDMTRLGAFVTKSISAEVRAGNGTTRIVETRAGMLNAIGLANVGLEVFLREKMPPLRALRGQGPRLIVNVVGHSIEDYVETAGRIASEMDVDAIELNVSCPNVSDGLVFGTDPVLLKIVVEQVRSAMRPACRLIVKLSPNVGDITATAGAAVDGGTDVISMVNTFTGLAVDIKTRQPRLANRTGGLSGPAIKPLAVQLVSRVYREVARDAGVPIIGMGGIQFWQDAAEFVLAGASGLAVGTALFIDPSVPNTILDGLVDYVEAQGCRALHELVGALA